MPMLVPVLDAKYEAPGVCTIKSWSFTIGWPTLRPIVRFTAPYSRVVEMPVWLAITATGTTRIKWPFYVTTA